MSDSAEYKGAERRRDGRVALKIPVDYTSVDAFFTEFSGNINEGGIFIEMDKPPELETDVQLHFRLPGADKPVQVAGRVAWISEGGDGQKPGVGVEFQDLPSEIRERINAVVRDLRSKT